MRGGRSLVSALAIVTGAVLLVAWAISMVVIRAVDDGSAASTLLGRAFATPQVMDQVSGEVQAAASDQLADAGINLSLFGLDALLGEIVDRAVRSDVVRDAVTDQTVAAQAQVAGELRDPDRAPGPLVVSMDLTDTVNSRIDEAVPGTLSLPEVALPPVDVELMDAESFENARLWFRVMEVVAQYGGWVGAALILIGLVASSRRRWFLPRAAMAVGVLSLGLWAVLRFTELGRGEPAGDGQDEGLVARLSRTFVTEELTGIMETRALQVGLVAAVVAAVLSVVAALMGRRTRA